MKDKLALHIICKDEHELVNNLIIKYREYFDEIAIAYDDDIIPTKVQSDEKVKLHKYLWSDEEQLLGIPHFANKRNFLAEKTESDYYLRIDTDDDIIGVEKVRALFEKMVQFQADVILVPYLYSFDKDGNCNSKHWRETIIHKSDRCKWNKAIHENILAKDENNFINVNDDSIAIKHNIDEHHVEKSGRRNFKVLMAEFDKDQENTDPRTLAYIGRMLLGYGEYEKATKFLRLLIEKSGWIDDKYFAWIDMAHCYLFLGKKAIAIACCNEALAINTNFPDAYNTLGEIYLSDNDYEKAVHWLSIGVGKPEPRTNYVVDPSSYTVRSPMNLAMALMGVGEIDKAYRVFKTVQKQHPSDTLVQGQAEFFEDSFERNNYVKNLVWMSVFLKERDEKKLKALIESIPDQMFEDERVCSLRNRIATPTKWGSNSVVIYCGRGWEDWSPYNTVTGIGGSEEAVIYISRELNNLGYKVTVYNTCGNASGDHQGVEYRPFFEFNPNDEFNILVSWRNNMFQRPFKAKKKLIWLHDVPMKEMFNGEILFDKVIVLSEYHKSLLPTKIPRDKIFVSANGINLEDFKETGVVREPHRCIYTSSYDRGLQHLLLMWENIRKEVPDAELHIFYGWNTFDKIALVNDKMAAYKETMMRLMQQPGVFEHGRIGHKKLVKELQKSKFWVYPSHFPEISCISAMKAQSANCYPVCTDYAALKETVKGGAVVSGNANDEDVQKRFKEMLIMCLKSQPVIQVDKEQFGWDKVAKQWKEELFQ